MLFSPDEKAGFNFINSSTSFSKFSLVVFEGTFFKFHLTLYTRESPGESLLNLP
jgi:hypothetical protein